jgi:hypothetical protein
MELPNRSINNILFTEFSMKEKMKVNYKNDFLVKALYLIYKIKPYRQEN